MKGESSCFLAAFLLIVYIFIRARRSLRPAALDPSSPVAPLAAGGYDLSGDLLGLFFFCADRWRMTNPLFKRLGARLKTCGAEEINCRCRGDASGFQANSRQSLIWDKSVCNVATETQLPTVLPPGGESSRGVLTPPAAESLLLCRAHSTFRAGGKSQWPRGHAAIYHVGTFPIVVLDHQVWPPNVGHRCLVQRQSNKTILLKNGWVKFILKPFTVQTCLWMCVKSCCNIWNVSYLYVLLSTSHNKHSYV